jgi:hypothetical protein
VRLEKPQLQLASKDRDLDLVKPLDGNAMTSAIRCLIQSPVAHPIEALGVPLQNSALHPASQSHLDILFQVAGNLLSQSPRVPLGTRAWLAMQLLDCADDLDAGRLVLSALPKRLNAIAAALPSHVPDPVIQLGQILERAEHLGLSSDPAAQLTAIAQQLITEPPSVQGLNATGLFTASI